MKTLTKEKTGICEKTGAELLISALSDHGVDTIFGYPGSPLLSVYDVLSKNKKIRHILSRHEQGAFHSAEGYARVSGKAGVVLVTSGPGFTNTLTGILNAQTDKTPILVLTAQSENIGQNEFQEVNVGEVTKTISKKSYLIERADNIQEIIHEALKETQKLPMGVVVVAIKKSALETCSNPKEIKNRIEIKVEAPHSCVLRAINSLQNASKPLIILGGGCVGSEQEIRELVEQTRIPVVNTLMGSGIADNISCGLIGVDGDSKLNVLIKKSDVVLALGTRFSDRTTNYTGFLPNSKIISINIEQLKSDTVNISEEILGELKIVLRQMIGAIKANNVLFDIKYEWISAFDNDKDDICNSELFTSEAALNKIYRYTKKYNPIVTTDVGEHQILSAKIFRTSAPRSFLTSGGFGTMGYGLPAAIGAYFAKPNALIMNISGDGSFQMNMQELGTCAEYNVPVKIFIINNSSLGMIKTQQKNNHYSDYQSTLINPDFVKIAQAYGIQGYTVSSSVGLESVLDKIFTYKKAVIVDIKTA